MGRRPRRAQPSNDELIPVEEAAVENNEEERQGNENEMQDDSQDTKEAAIWEEFKEEYYEATDQLPLSLHRQYSLLRELEEQAASYAVELPQLIERYILLRRFHARSSKINQPGHSITNGKPTAAVPPAASPGHVDRSSDGDEGSKVIGESNEKPDTEAIATVSSSIDDESLRDQSSREILARIASLSQELVRASEEKVSLAQAATDSIDRHIRLLDQAIREQETSLQLGLRSGTQPAPITLPEVATVPRWARSTRIVCSPIPALSDDEGMGEVAQAADQDDAPPTLGIVDPESAQADDGSATVKNKKRGRGRAKKPKPEVEDTALETTRPRRDSAATRSVKLTVRSHLRPSRSGPPKDEIDPSERLYCYCNRVSFGEMIGCDNNLKCQREWFHLECVGLKEAPKGRWFCRDCEKTVSRRART